MLFSIICPIYNSEKHLDKAIGSVLCQTFSDWELLLIDDGSSDASPIICDKYARLDKRIIVIHKNNEGQMKARIDGLKLSLGDYILFMDSDDFLETCSLQVLADKIKKFKTLDTIVFNANVIRENDSINPKKIPVIKNEKLLNNNNSILKALFGEEIFGYLWMYCFKRTFIVKQSKQIEQSCYLRYTEDLLFLFSIMKSSNSSLFIKEYLYNYYLNTSSITHSLSLKDREDRFNVYNNIYPFLFELKINIDMCVAKTIVWAAISYLENAVEIKNKNVYSAVYSSVVNSWVAKSNYLNVRFFEKYPSFIVWLLRHRFRMVLYYILRMKRRNAKKD